MTLQYERSYNFRKNALFVLLSTMWQLVTEKQIKWKYTEKFTTWVFASTMWKYLITELWLPVTGIPHHVYSSSPNIEILQFWFPRRTRYCPSSRCNNRIRENQLSKINTYFQKRATLTPVIDGIPKHYINFKIFIINNNKNYCFLVANYYGFLALRAHIVFTWFFPGYLECRLDSRQ